MADAGILKARYTDADFKSVMRPKYMADTYARLGWKVPSVPPFLPCRLEGNGGQATVPEVRARSHGATAVSRARRSGSGLDVRRQDLQGLAGHGLRSRIERRRFWGRNCRCGCAARPLVVVKSEGPRQAPGGDRTPGSDVAATRLASARWRQALAQKARRIGEVAAQHWLLFVLLALWQYFSIRYPDLKLQLPPPTERLHRRGRPDQKGIAAAGHPREPQRVGIALGAASLIGFPLGALLGGSRYFAWSVEPVVGFFRPIPPLAWIPLSILWFGIGDAQNVFIIFLAAVFPIILNTMEGVRDVDTQLDSRCAHARREQFAIAFTVILPAALPVDVRRLQRRHRHRVDGARRRRARRVDQRPRLPDQPGAVPLSQRLHHRRHGADRRHRPDARRLGAPAQAIVTPWRRGN